MVVGAILPDTTILQESKFGIIKSARRSSLFYHTRLNRTSSCSTGFKIMSLCFAGKKFPMTMSKNTLGKQT